MYDTFKFILDPGHPDDTFKFILDKSKRQEIRDLCRVIVRRDAEQSADKVLQQLKSEYCCPEGRAPLPDV